MSIPFRDSVILLVAYLAAAWFGIAYTSMPPGNLGVLWLPTGIALIGLITLGWRALPILFIAISLSNWPTILDASNLWGSMGHAMIFSVVYTLQHALAYALYRRFIEISILDEISSFLKFLFGVSLLPAMLTSWAIVLNFQQGGYVSISGAEQWREYVFNLTLSDALGIFILLPLYVSLKNFKLKYIKLQELKRFSSMLIFLGIVAFWMFFRDTGYPIALILPLTAIALTNGLAGTAFSYFLITTSSILLTVNGYGPFLVSMSNTSSYGLMYVMIGLGLPSFLIAISMHNMRKLTHSLEKRVAERTSELADLNQSKDQLISIIAHDLRNPLQGVIGLSDLLVQDAKDKKFDEVQDYAEMISSSSRQVLQLLQNLLDWAAAQSGRMKYLPQTINVSGIVKEAMSLFIQAADAKSIRLIADIDTQLTAKVDKQMMATIIRNLISNAIKYTPSGGTVQTSLHSDGSSFTLKVVDTGIGMTHDQIQQLLSSTKGDTTSGTEGEKGSGLGLLLVQEFTHQHGARFHVESTPGAGSAFEIHFPLIE